MNGETGGRASSQPADHGSVGRRIFTNFSFLLLAQAVAAVAGLLSTAWLARALGAEAYGILGFGTAILAYFGLIVVAGTDVYGMRSIAQSADSVAMVVRRILGLRAVLLVIALLTYLVTVWALGLDERVRLVLWIQGFGLIATALSLDFVFQGVQRMGPVAARQGLAALLVLAGVLSLIRNPDDIYWAAAIPVIAITLSVVWQAVRMNRHLAPVSLKFEPSAWRPMITAVFPIIVLQTVNAVFYQMDILMLGLMGGSTETGIYVGMSRLYAMAILVGGLLGTAFSPALAGAWPDGPAMRARYREFLTVCVLAGAPISAVPILWPDSIITIVFGPAFAAGHTALVVLMATAFLTYATFPVAAALLAWHDQVVEMTVMIVGGGLNIGLNLLLIPRFGIEGAATATLVSQGFLLVALMVRLRVRFGFWELARPVKLAAVAAAVFASIGGLAAAGIEVPGPVWFSFAVHAALSIVLYVSIVAACGLVAPAQLWRRLWDRQGGNPARGLQNDGKETHGR